MGYILLFLIGVAFVCCGTLMASIIMTILCQTKWYIRLVNKMSKKFIGGLMEEEET